ncbi:multiubiquitin domain-containing protein [Polaromonas sp. SM01]|uniref:multiubiquitin domain-containing protein n=1 Tax=Polaromonas sp. SM01 TaxID=3085630 RepID=UPI002980AA49|nr:multiubiquitin domain-containing protein [Polaromonas sp. SM01]MDW5443808.1 multiubiquitin domain-containing protein [Polaromonas sp. SM01]
MSNGNSSEAPGHNKSYDIVVNGKQRTVTENSISYEQVVRLAFPEGPFDILYTVAYANLHGKDGTLAPGQDTHVKEGMSFNVVKTNRS